MVVRSWGNAELARRVRRCESREEFGGEEVVHAFGGGVEVAVVEVETAAGEDEGAEAVTGGGDGANAVCWHYGGR